MSKVFEYCIFDKFKDYLATADNQFGFKKNVDAVLQSVLYVASLTIM